ncbi:MAG: hypothetical protein JAY90_23325 [Candidatus Thiodiazotropha lotti]|nr:hypothetical protein [Candidatus Thiodiazotropha lotti]
MENQGHTSSNNQTIPEVASSAISVLEHKIYQMDVAISLLSNLEKGDINEIGSGIGQYTYRAIAIEYANNARMNISEVLDEVRGYIGSEASLPDSLES